MQLILRSACAENRLARIGMMTMTTRSSIRVKPARGGRELIVFMVGALFILAFSLSRESFPSW